MTKKSFKKELESLLFAFGVSSISLSDPRASKVKDDFDHVLKCYYVRKTRRYLIWGLLIGRSVDSFTGFFLDAKLSGFTGNFNDRINRICSTTSPLTSDLTIKSDLRTVKGLRNDLFHNSGRHLNDSEMEDFLFKSVRCVQQLIRDL
jgi:hypothetical protein